MPSDVDAKANTAGIERRVHPHAFCHTFSAELVQESQSLDVVRQSLGHGSVTTTAKSLRRIAPGQPGRGGPQPAQLVLTERETESDPADSLRAPKRVPGLV